MSSRFERYEEVVEKLNHLPMFGRQGKSAANFSLKAIRDFCEHLGNPQNQFRSIHVAGTNGKGTTCRMIASVYQSAGYKTGLFTSPHLVDYRERFMINGQWIEKTDLLRFFKEYKELVESASLTYFELSTAIAYWYFNEMRVDVAIIETGLGGRLDATNIVQPLVSVITSVGLDHTDILGETIGEIATEKAGIIKPGVPVVTGFMPESALYQVKKVAESKKAPVFDVQNAKDVLRDFCDPEQSFETKTLAEALNLQTVLLTLNCASKELPVTESNIRSGIKKWVNRYPTGGSFRKIHPHYRWFFDGAHNPDALRLLKKQLQKVAPLDKWVYVMAMMNDKLTAAVLEELREFPRIVYFRPDLERAATCEQVRKLLPETQCLPQDEGPVHEWLQKHKSELVIFGGSFYFYQTVERWMENIADL